MKQYRIAAVILAALLSNLCFVGNVGALIVTETLPQADRVVVRKAARTLALMKHGKAIKTYRISLGKEPFGHKQREGDSRTPEGNYLIDWRNPNSLFHLSLHISYPGTNDKGKAERGGYSPGGAVMIHGRPNIVGGIDFLFTGRDWTDGCIAVTNAEIEEIWQSVPDGTPITILP